MGGGDHACLRARKIALLGQFKQIPYFIQREPKLPRPAHEIQPEQMAAAIEAMPTLACSQRGWASGRSSRNSARFRC